MSDQNKTKAQLMEELQVLRGHMAELQRLAGERGWAGAMLASDQQSDQLLRSIIDATPDWIFVKDREHRYRLANQGYAHALHLKPEDFVGKDDLDLGFPEELVKGNPEKGIRGFWADDRLVMDSGQPQVYPNDPATIDGVVHTFHTIKTPLRDAEGQVWGVLAFARDVTDLQQVEKALRQNQAQLSETLKVAQLAYWEFDVPSQMFTFNDQLYSLFHTTAEREGGYQMSAAEFTHKFVHPDDAQVVGGELGRAIEAADPNYSAQFESRVIRDDGQEGYIAVRARISKDAQGRTLTMYGTNEDITERKQTELLLSKRVKELDCLNDIGRKAEEALPVSEFLQWVTERIPPAMQYPDKCIVDVEFEGQVYGVAEALKQPCQIVGGLHIGGEQVGRLCVAYTEKRDFLDEESALLGSIVRRVSGYIENRRLLEQAQQSEQLLRSIIDATPDWIFIKDREHHYRLANQGYANALHLQPDDFIGKNDLDLGFPEELVKGNPEKGIRGFWADDRLVMDSGQPQVYPNDPATIDGVVHTFHSIKTPLRDAEGQVWGVLAFARDVTDRERLLTEQQRRAVQLQTAAEVSRAASSILNLDELLPQVVELVRERFNLYYTGLFLVDDTGQWAVLRAGTGEAGKKMLEAAHQLEVGGASMIGACITHAQARIALDVGAEAVRFENPLLPLTRSEMALPLISRGRVIGAATIQSDQPSAFTQEDITILQTTADQVANAIENARLFQQTRARAEEMTALNELSRALATAPSVTQVLEEVHRGVSRLLDTTNFYISLYDPEKNEVSFPINVSESVVDRQIAVLPADQGITGYIIRTRESVLIQSDVSGWLAERGMPHVGEPAQSWLGVPLMLGAQVLGVMAVQNYAAPNVYDEHDRDLLVAIASQAAIALQNARSLEQTQARARREQALREITARVRGSTDPDAIVRAAVRELGVALGRPAFVRLDSAERLAQSPSQQTIGHTVVSQPVGKE